MGVFAKRIKALETSGLIQFPLKNELPNPASLWGLYHPRHQRGFGKEWESSAIHTKALETSGLIQFPLKNELPNPASLWGLYHPRHHLGLGEKPRLILKCFGKS